MCGIIGITHTRDAARLAYLGLFALQHRGQESAGIVTSGKDQLTPQVGMGLVAEVFNEQRLKKLPGTFAIGHVRYATTGASHIANAQPLVFNLIHGPVAIAHNGNLTNAANLRSELERKGAIFQSTTDSEVIVHLLARRTGPIEDALLESLRQVVGAYSLLLLAPQKLIAARDPWGFRPLVLGKLGNSYVLASETCALNLMRAQFLREIEPGEMLVIEGGNLKSIQSLPAVSRWPNTLLPQGPRDVRPPASTTPRKAMCIFEHVYFSRPDSMVFNRNVYASRHALGRELAREMKSVRADIVVPVPDSGVPAALGFSRESGIPFEMGFIRSHYIGRTFIQPLQVLREKSAEFKLAPIAEILKGKRIVLIDDSIVRATTSRKIAKNLRRAGVAEIHMGISSPPIISPCYYGIDTPRTEELIAANRSIEEIRDYLGVNSLHYLSEAGLLRAVAPKDSPDFCTACFNRKYPTPIFPPVSPGAGEKPEHSDGTVASKIPLPL